MVQVEGSNASDGGAASPASPCGRAQQIAARHLTPQPALLGRFEWAVKPCWNAYVFSFDGYYQAATGRREFWPGVRPLL